MLVHGPDGTGKRAFVAHVAAALLCDVPITGNACGICRNCRLLAAQSHPDFHVVEPESQTETGSDRLNAYARRYAPEKGKSDRKPSRVIRIVQIRSLIESMRGRPQIASRRVAIVLPAEAINVNAANSFLKLLEEPPPDTIFLLVASVPGRLPATVRSRCVPLALMRPSRAEAISWLRSLQPAIADPEACLDLASGAPLRAADFSRGGEAKRVAEIIADLESLTRRPGGLAACGARWKESGTARCLGWLEIVIADMVRLRLAPKAPHLRVPAARADLRRLGEQLNSNELIDFLDRVSRGRGLADGPLDEQLLIEDVLTAWLQLAAIGRPLPTADFQAADING
jgi:DNA polymerase-3 subunit delta'